MSSTTPSSTTPSSTTPNSTIPSSTLPGNVGPYSLNALRRRAGAALEFDATDTRLGRPVTLKVLFEANDSVRATLHREAQALMRVEHPNVVMLYDYSGRDDATPYIAYEPVQGEPLAQVVQTRGALPAALHAAIFLQAADALTALHEATVLHRDLSLDVFSLNVLGQVVLADLALATSDAATTRSGAGNADGATGPQYLAPELLTGSPHSAASDTYALCVAMYQALLGRTPLVDASDLVRALDRIRTGKLPRAVGSGLDAAPALLAMIDAVITAPPERRPTLAAVREVLRASCGATTADDIAAWLSGAAAGDAPMTTTEPALPGDLAARAALDLGDFDGALIAATGGRYEKLEPLGQGGMGRVVKAWDTRLRRHVAIKTMLDPDDSADAKLRFHREARALGRVRHTNIVEVTDYSGRDAPLPFLVLEYIDGATLAAVLQVTVMPEEVALSVLADLADALTTVHDNGLVHRDIKPDNIFVDDTGRVVLGDFGIVRGFSGEAGTFVRAHTSAIGSPLYASPEQVYSPEHTGPKSDVFSLASLTQAMLTGKSPFAGDTIQQSLSNLSEGRRAPLPKLSAALTTALQRMWAKEPAARPSAAEVRELAIAGLAARGISDRRRLLRQFLGTEADGNTRVFDSATRIHRTATIASGAKQIATPQARPPASPTASKPPPAPHPSPRQETAIADVTRIGASHTVVHELGTVTRSAAVGRAQPKRWPMFAGVMLLGAGLGAAAVLLLREPPAPPVKPTPPGSDVAVPAPTPSTLAPPDSLPEPAPAALPPPPPVAEPPTVPALAPSEPSRPPTQAARAAPATVRIITKPWANVSIDGDQVGMTPRFQSTELKPGRHTLVFENPAFTAQTMTVDLKPGEQREIRVQLQRK